MVYFQIRKKADAFLRSVGKRDVLYRFHRIGIRIKHETDLHVLRRFTSVGNKLSIFLYIAYCDDPRNANVLSRIHRRVDFQEFIQ